MRSLVVRMSDQCPYRIAVLLLIWAIALRCWSSSAESCGKRRQVFSASWGIIGDGEGDYPQDSHCEWLIQANSSADFINLKFIFMETECSYDHLYVYDGYSYNGPLLGSFSGRTLPPPIVASSGAMLVLLFSDTNYVLKGFEAEYSITECPLNCSQHGDCKDRVCECGPLWTGPTCDVVQCLDSCGVNEDRGDCIYELRPPSCLCSPDYSGASCSISVNDSSGDRWHTVAPSAIRLTSTPQAEKISNRLGLPPRAGHIAVYLPARDTMYVFGGYDLNRALDDLWAFDFNENKWKRLGPSGANKGPWPLARYAHAAAPYGNGFAMYGGVLLNGSFSNELWYLDATRGTWTENGTRSALRPPALARHTLTLAEHWVYLFGGSQDDGRFSSAMFRINLGEVVAQWERVRPLGGKEPDRRLVGHSTVFHAESRSLLVYGGVAVDWARFSKLSDGLHAFNVDTRYWSRLHYPHNSAPADRATPIERAFHSANVVGGYMVVFGGYHHVHTKEEQCYDPEVYLYHLGCHVWVDAQALRAADDLEGATREGSRYPLSHGLFSHATGVRNGNTLLIVGGYSGMVRGDFIAYTLPTSVAISNNFPKSSQSACSSLNARSKCKANPECGWCPSQTHNGTCMNRNNFSECSLYLEASECPGICPTLRDCHSCLAHGEGVRIYPGTPSGMAHLLPCSWCVQSRECHNRDHAMGMCSNTSAVTGWWGTRSTDISILDECRTKDMPPGITWLMYRHPPNWQQPDEVSVINVTQQQFTFLPEFSGLREPGAGGEYTARFLGFIHPNGLKLKGEGLKTEVLKLFMGVSHAKGVLMLSTDDSEKNLDVVANYTTESFKRIEAHRPNGKLLFPDMVHVRAKYLVDFRVHQSIDPSPTQLSRDTTSTMNLVWDYQPSARKEFTVENLEPYANGSSCLAYSNCLQCVSDSKCGWCESSSACLSRVNTTPGSGRVCIDGGHLRYLVTQSSDCILCSDHIYCEDCVQTAHCDWMVKEAHCVRRGRFLDAISNASSCPISCHLRPNCSSCLGDPGRCAWCEHLQQCFLFSTYMSTYVYGTCREWFDEDRFMGPSVAVGPGTQCRTCSSHKTCKDCLTDLSCGWCYSEHNPLVGVCTEGDFLGPSKDVCRTLLAVSNKIPAVQPTDWSYGFCPDVEECSMGLHTCHANATCTNTFDAYICTCNRGFRGDGNDTCSKTCYDLCVHGFCSEAPNYTCVCGLGWTGPDCGVNCGCNNHSTCAQGVGICDECRDWTEGQFCERCRPGSFGNATSDIGCQRCDCNRHGNATEGFCNIVTGLCYCQDNTEGVNCDSCQPGFYGDPRNGGQCYKQCGSRVLMTNIESGGLGSQPGEPSDAVCLWILTVHSDLDNASIRSASGSSSSILLTIQPDLQVRCSDNAVYVYDGLPSFVSNDPKWDHESTLLGAFCSKELREPITVEAHSGYMTVLYSRDHAPQGFNATFEVHRCPELCEGNRTCVRGPCQCIEGFAGKNCDVELCPNNCSSNLSRGRCIHEYGRCACSDDYTGLDCSQAVTHSLLLTTLFDPVKLSSNAKRVIREPRMGHTMVADHNASLWLFGGLSLSKGLLNDMHLFDTDTNMWVDDAIRMQTGSTPPKGRYFHAATYVAARREIFVFGGLTRNEVLNDFWKFNVVTSQWTQLPMSSRIQPLAGHTLTVREDESLVMLGGFDTLRGFLDKTLAYDLKSGEWFVMNVTGPYPIGIYGHSTVYHHQTESFYVYGGILFKADKTRISNELYALHYPTRRWTVLPPSVEGKFGPFTGPVARYLHAAATTPEYMVVVGGRSIDGVLVDSIHAYIYTCNMWVDLLNDGAPTMGSFTDASEGLSVTSTKSGIFIYGGFAGNLLGTLSKLVSPDDLCNLYRTKQSCQRRRGCSSCAVHPGDGVNRTVCYSNKNDTPATSCLTPTGTVDITRGMSCNNDWLEERNCYQYTSCLDCLATWPAHPTAKHVCQWCTNCQLGQCVSNKGSCDVDNNCHLARTIPKDASLCPERICLASDCERCAEQNNCIWTRQVLRSSEMTRTLHEKPIYDWNCVQKGTFKLEVISMPPKPCPARCVELKDCMTCLGSEGAEGGWHECRWSETLKECISPGYQALRCAGGVCGQVIGGSQKQCPRRCMEFTQCRHCLEMPHCGWCAFSDEARDGLGVCIEGGLDGPRGGSCRVNNVTLFREVMPVDASNWLRSAKGPPLWAYMNCPAENECSNNHHTCDRKSEECFDTPLGFECRCRDGYVLEGKHCKPVCEQGCVNGTCVEPNKCVCHFSYVDRNCSTQCKCNGHSNCASVEQLDVCLDCHNNTKGNHCEICEPFFVGDPRNDGQCIPCRVYCNGHSDLCLSRELVNATSQTLSTTWDTNHFEELKAMVTQGATVEAVCLNCQHFTEGDRCDSCVYGYFRSGNSPQDTCQPCECNGHSDICNRINGESCQCENNTETDPQCNQKGKANTTPCWKLQCSKCKDQFLGTPTNGHQCYRQMYVDRDYCFDPAVKDECNIKSNPLLQGRTVFFMVQPKYLNVDIRIVVDVTVGGVDLYFSPTEDTFVVSTNKSTGFHTVVVDSKYGIDVADRGEFPTMAAASSRQQLMQMQQRRARSIDALKRGSETETTEITVNLTDSVQHYKVRERNAMGLNTFIPIAGDKDFLIVRNLRNRLTITLPHEVHNLRSTRFFIVLHGAGSETSSESYGSIFFRQDQPRIDLFVFFSVFFSCFFLFLAVCVVIWKVKQAVDMQRARQRHAVEMEHMASRPFAAITVIVDEDQEELEFRPPYSPSAFLAKKLKSVGGFMGGGGWGLCVRPVALEPTEDGVAAVGTAFVQLPGGSSAPVRLALGSALVLFRAPNSGYNSIKACMRRRASHHNA